MDCTSTITSIIVSLCSALLGGGLTLLGVWLTIKDQNKKEEAAKKAAVRPWIFSYEECIPPYKKTCFIAPDSDYSRDIVTSGIIKNTDTGILILDYVESELVRYTLHGDNVVDKNSTVELAIHLKNRVENLNGLRLYIKDVYGNRYSYEISIRGSRFTLGECREV